MRAWRHIREPLLAAMLWAVIATVQLALNDVTGAVLLTWVPSGVAVAAFYVVRKIQWPVLVIIMLPVKAATIWLAGTVFPLAMAYAFSSTVQSLIVAVFSVMAMGSRHAFPTRFRQLAGGFSSAVLGCLVGATIALPFRTEQTVAEFSWWFLANVLGILIASPLLLMVFRQLTGRGREDRFERSLVSLLLGCTLLALIALQVRQVELMPLLVAAMVVAAVRYGQIASLLVVLIYAAVAMALSALFGSPMPSMELSAEKATLVMQNWMIIMVATTLPIAAMLLKRRELQLELMERNREMRESLMLFDLAEKTAGIGRWRLDLRTGKQDWSAKMLEMNGLPRSLAPDPGDVRDRLPDGGRELFEQIAQNGASREVYSLVYRIRPAQELERILRMSMLNEFDDDGNRVAVFGVAQDVTEQTRREEALDAARGRAMRLASEAQILANTDSLTNLPNRRCTFSRLDTMMVVAENCASPLSAVLFDIDHFKHVNDTYGHQVGDDVIVAVADLARGQARSSDIVGRVGGEEFVWLIPGTGDAAVRRLAERLRAAVEHGTAQSGLPQVTISMGIAHLRRGDTYESLIARADAALYDAKNGGRNQVRRAA